MKIELKIIPPGEYSLLSFLNGDDDDILFYLDDAVISYVQLNKRRFSKFLQHPLIISTPF